MTFHTDLADRINAWADELETETDPAIWAVRAVGVITTIIGDETLDLPDDVRYSLEALFVLAPDPIIAATVAVKEIIERGSK